MSETIQLNVPFYKIIPVETGKALTGVGRILPTFQPVHVGADITTWHIRKAGEDVYRLSLKNSYPFVGVDSDRTVIASVIEADEKLWRIKKVKDWHGSGDVFSIELNTEIWPFQAWTLSSKQPDAKITLSFYELAPWESQLFRIVPLLE